MDLMQNPSFRNFITQFHALMESTQKVSLQKAREECTAFFSPPTLQKEPIARIENIKILSREGHFIPIRLYIPKGENLPFMVYYHRGGWVFSNIEEADPVCRKLANHLGCIVASVDYRLAPENPFPKPFCDAYEALLWAYDHAPHFNGDRQKIFVLGESCGGNLAAAVSLRARDEGHTFIKAQVLLYPMVHPPKNEEVYQKSADQYFITKESMQFFWGVYLQQEADRKNPYASLDQAQDLSSLPPTLIWTAEHDPLYLEGEILAQKLQEAHVFVSYEKVPGVIHGFLDLPLYDSEQIILWIESIKEKLEPHLWSMALCH